MTEKNEAADFDELLSTPPTATEVKSLQDLKDEGRPDPVETEEQKRIRQLEEQIAALTAAKSVPEEIEKSPEQKAQEHAQAVAKTRQLLSSPEAFEEVPEDADTIHLHVLESGITAFGRVWHVGQEISIPRGGQAYKDTINRSGVSWLDDLSAATQVARWGKIQFGIGPWPFAPFNDELAAEDAKRGARVPVVRL